VDTAGTGFVKDCKAAYDAGICLISAANSAINLKHRLTDTRPSSSADIIVHSGRQYLKAGRDIMPHEEILTAYSSSYRL